MEKCERGTGACQAGIPVTCDDGDVCTVDSCDHATGACSFNPIGGCCNTDAHCDDSNACTTDHCEVTTHTGDHVLKNCDNGNICDVSETSDPATGDSANATPPSSDDAGVGTGDNRSPHAGRHDDAT